MNNDRKQRIINIFEKVNEKKYYLMFQKMWKLVKQKIHKMTEEDLVLYNIIERQVSKIENTVQDIIKNRNLRISYNQSVEKYINDQDFVVSNYKIFQDDIDNLFVLFHQYTNILDISKEDFALLYSVHKNLLPSNELSIDYVWKKLYETIKYFKKNENMEPIFKLKAYYNVFAIYPKGKAFLFLDVEQTIFPPGNVSIKTKVKTKLNTNSLLKF